MRQCPNCKTNNPDDARFCNYCGMRLPNQKRKHYTVTWMSLKKPRRQNFPIRRSKKNQKK